ncbi:hypothetical protein [Streptomyces plumbiresistens]|uniref:hypothetical protein n=1 Tax=Streptomyces plumbiresistens TaxID=511811 RepID=UPI0031E9755D
MNTLLTCTDRLIERYDRSVEESLPRTRLARHLPHRVRRRYGPRPAGEFACYFAAGFFALPTAGVGGALVAAGCTAAGFAAGQLASSAVG